MSVSQFPNWSICQQCGRGTKRGTLHWLDLPDVKAKLSGVRVVRCPVHWTEWAMRHTSLGRTNDGKFRMLVANKFAAENGMLFRMNPYIEPIPGDDVTEFLEGGGNHNAR